MTGGAGRLARVAGAAALVLGLAACTADEPDPGSDDAAPATSAKDGAPTDVLDGFRTAAETALGEVDGTVVAVGHEPDAWDVVVVTADGSEHEIDLSADATTVSRHRVETAADDPDDAAERKRLLGAGVDHLTAVESALGEVEGKVNVEVSGVELAEGDGSVVWEVEMGEETPDAVTVVVDASSGDVVATEREG